MTGPAHLSPRATRALAILLGLVLLGACADQGPSPEERASEIRSARVVFGPAVAELGAAVLETEEAVTGVRLGQPPAPDDRLGAVEAIRQEVLPSLEEALEATEIDPPGDDPAIEEARTSWQEAREAAEEVLSVAREDLGHTERLAEIDAAISGIVAEWEAPGSHSQQVERFTDLGNRARAHVVDLQEVDPRPGCSEGVQRRRDAARWVADSTEELRGLIERRRGEEFDARRQELTASVYGIEDADGDPRTILATADERDRDCWSSEGATPTAAGRFEAAVEEVEAALNPDL